MERFEWNALRQGDKVLTHDEGAADLGLLRGTVVIVEPRPGSNSVAIRLETKAGPVVHRPRRLWVHLDEGDMSASCWRCALSSGRAAAA